MKSLLARRSIGASSQQKPNMRDVAYVTTGRV